MKNKATPEDRLDEKIGITNVNVNDPWNPSANKQLNQEDKHIYMHVDISTELGARNKI